MLTGIIRGQRLMLRTPIVVADSINYLTAKFAFDADWKGRVITAYFVCGDKTITAELTSGEITGSAGNKPHCRTLGTETIRHKG